MLTVYRDIVVVTAMHLQGVCRLSAFCVHRSAINSSSLLHIKLWKMHEKFSFKAMETPDKRKTFFRIAAKCTRFVHNWRCFSIRSSSCKKSFLIVQWKSFNPTSQIRGNSYQFKRCIEFSCLSAFYCFSLESIEGGEKKRFLFSLYKSAAINFTTIKVNKKLLLRSLFSVIVLAKHAIFGSSISISYQLGRLMHWPPKCGIVILFAEPTTNKHVNKVARSGSNYSKVWLSAILTDDHCISPFKDNANRQNNLKEMR